MKKILIDMEVDSQAAPKLKALSGVEVRFVEPYENLRPLPPELIRDVNFLFCSYPPTNLSDMTALEVIQIASAGYSQLFGLGLVERKIRACNAAGVNDIPIAQWNIAMMINLLRDLRGMIRNQEHGVWERPARFQQDLRGQTVGIWGYGGIGRETARLAKSIGMRVHILDLRLAQRPNMFVVAGTGDPEGKLPDQVFGPDQQKEFLGGLDFLVLSMPLTKRTEGIIGIEQLKMLRPHAFVLNPARGPLIKEPALLEALRTGLIAGAALDTHYYYPMPADHPLWRFPNVIMTPHISGSTKSPNFLSLLWDLLIANVQRYLRNDPLLNELSAAQLNGE